MDKDVQKRLKRHLIQRGILFLVIIAVLCFVFDFKLTGWEIRTFLYFFGIMALATVGVWFFRYLDYKNLSIFEYLEQTFGPRSIYIWYILGAVSVGVILTKLIA